MMKFILIAMLSLVSLSAFSQTSYYNCESWYDEADLVMNRKGENVVVLERMQDRTCYSLALDFNIHIMTKGVPKFYKCVEQSKKGRVNTAIYSNLGLVTETSYTYKRCQVVAKLLTEAL